MGALGKPTRGARAVMRGVEVTQRPVSNRDAGTENQVSAQLVTTLRLQLKPLSTNWNLIRQRERRCRERERERSQNNFPLTRVSGNKNEGICLQ